MSNTIFDFTVKTGKGKETALREYEGKVLLIVNTASRCGFTPQYKGLEALYKKYKDAGLVVLGFPCNQFAHQEPGTDAEIESFCEINFGVTFPLMGKINVNGRDADPLFKFLKQEAPGAMGNSIKWNFTKFLVSREGTKVTRFASKIEPADIEMNIQKELGL